MIRRILRSCRGYVRLEISGAALERFVNLCRQSGIELWDIRRPAADRMVACMSAGDWKAFAPRCSRTLCTAAVLEQGGLRRSLAPFGRRKCLLITAALCMGLCLLSGQLLWRVRIEGCEDIPPRELYDQLRGLGLEPGVWRERIDCGRIRSGLMTLRDDLSYASINIRGTEAHVTVVEKDREKAAEALPSPCDLYADKAGIIEKLQVRDGAVQAAEGDTVIPGDLLVAGTMTSTQGEVRQVPADADVLLRTWRTVEAAMSPEVYGYTETGVCRSRWSLIVGSRRLALPCIEKSGDACYYKTMETTAVSLDGGYFFPLTLVREIWHECTAYPLDLSEAACGEVLRAACHRILDAQCVEDGVRETDFSLIFTEDRIEARLQAECLETTGTKIPIIGENK